MTQHEVARTLVKSAPELWEVCSDPDSLGRHLEAFGEIRITRVEPETTVAWEGERASGTVRIEPSGWGTRVTLTAIAAAVAEPEPLVAESEPAAAEPEPVAAEPEPVAAEPEPEPAASEAVVPPRRGLFRRLGGLLFRSFVTPVEVPEDAFTPEQAPIAEQPEPEPEPVLEPVVAEVPVTEPEPSMDPGSVLTGVLDRLGSDHHRPFSRG